MPPAPASPGDTPRFDPRSEKFLESLRNLIEFKVRRENFDENIVEIHHLFSRSMIDALEFATHELEGEGWYVISITRIWDTDFIESPAEGQNTQQSTDKHIDQLFFQIVDHFGSN